jgi:hypothetical protein
MDNNKWYHALNVEGEKSIIPSRKKKRFCTTNKKKNKKMSLENASTSSSNTYTAKSLHEKNVSRMNESKCSRLPCEMQHSKPELLNVHRTATRDRTLTMIFTKTQNHMDDVKCTKRLWETIWPQASDQLNIADPSSTQKVCLQEMRLIFPTPYDWIVENITSGLELQFARSNEFIIWSSWTRPVVKLDNSRSAICHTVRRGLLFFLAKNCVLRHDIEDRVTISENRANTLNAFESSSVQGANILRFLLPALKQSPLEWIITFSNDNDFISFHHKLQNTGREVDLHECGPRFELQL